jgi:hypothetical protein
MGMPSKSIYMFNAIPKLQEISKTPSQQMWQVIHAVIPGTREVDIERLLIQSQPGKK